MGGFSLQLGLFSFNCIQTKRIYLTASFHRFWHLPKAVQWGFQRISEQGISKSLQPVGQAAEFNLSPTSSPCLSSGNHSRKLFQKTIEGFDCKINDPSLGAALWHSLGGSDRRVPARGVSESLTKLLTKAVLIASLSLSIIHWSLSKHRAYFPA